MGTIPSPSEGVLVLFCRMRSNRPRFAQRWDLSKARPPTDQSSRTAVNGRKLVAAMGRRDSNSGPLLKSCLVAAILNAQPVSLTTRRARCASRPAGSLCAQRARPGLSNHRIGAHPNPARQRPSVPFGRGRLVRSGPPRPGTDRPAGHGKADHRVKSSGGLLISLVVDLDLGMVLLDGSVAAEDPDGYAGKDEQKEKRQACSKD
jgi:hypothetical protein